ncbi:hydroxymethylbilane synthase [Candidatus Nitrosotalea okcheonensis]|uniref:Probable porphobilinogen deaminase n=1 Tax=Candidatus Nitrosotalea okcheonensis TaxID=1903276 RepID=A0A2H1FC49_9ARCH|nr:hydroxymethylbilane synthase [Candidatus Nitrosotalea okcheonensis]SMH70219.1 putative porphobilinogen deaminase [Candidatus Nitrosotalea okcheonensis]
MKYVIGTRGSQLSLTQTNWVVSEIKKKSPQTEFEIITIKTQGDTDARPLFTINQKGIFEKEIDRAVAERKVDFAVHSLKDVPVELPEDLVLACVPKREEANDVFIANDGSMLNTIKKGALIGTSSLRRAVQITRIRPDVVVKPIRGNIETRIRKVHDGEFDGVVLAQAGITRLGLGVKFQRLSMDTFPPSPGQGALGIVSRKDNVSLIELLKKIEDPETRNAIEAERSLSMFVDSGCRFPVGAFAHRDNDRLKLKVIVYSIDGKKSIMVEKDSETSKANDLGKQVATELREKGISDIAKDWREKVEEWNNK